MGLGVGLRIGIGGWYSLQLPVSRGFRDGPVLEHQLHSHSYTDSYTDGCTDGCTDGRTNGRAHSCTDGCTYGFADRLTDAHADVSSVR